MTRQDALYGPSGAGEPPSATLGVPPASASTQAQFDAAEEITRMTWRVVLRRQGPATERVLDVATEAEARAALTAAQLLTCSAWVWGPGDAEPRWFYTRSYAILPPVTP